MIEVCTCGSVGAPKEIRFAACHHRYFLGDRELEACSHVIKAIFPKKSWDGVDPAVVERANVRGTRTEAYVNEYIRTGKVTLEPGEWLPVRERVDYICDWLDKAKADRIDVQQIAYSEEDGIAATKDLDVWKDGNLTVIDIKNTAQAEVGWKLQLGCQAAYTPEATALYALHVTAKGCKLLPYDIDECRQIWRVGSAWWKTMRELK